MTSALPGRADATVNTAPAIESQYHNQHVVSGCLLRRWTGAPARGRVGVVAKDTGGVEERTTRLAGSAPDFVRFEPGVTEAVWGQLETKLPPVFSALDAGTLLDDRRLLKLARKCLALHWARSKPVLILHYVAARRAYQSQAAELILAEGAKLDQLIKERTGLVFPEGVFSQRAWMAEELLSGFETVVNSGEIFAEHIIRHYHHAQEYMRAFPLQVAVVAPDAGEFVIGDAPAISIRSGHDGLGLLGGVKLHEATGFFMPLGPSHMIGFGPEPKTHVLDAQAVSDFNVMQIDHAISEVYFQPGSGVEDFVTAHLSRRWAQAAEGS